MHWLKHEPTMKDIRTERPQNDILPYLQLLLAAAYNWRLGVDYSWSPRVLTLNEHGHMSYMLNLDRAELDAYIQRLERRIKWVCRCLIRRAYPVR